MSISPKTRDLAGKKVVVIGAGIIGLSTAWRAAQAGAQVTVFDRGEIGSESSWAGAGMLSPGGETDGPSVLASLTVEARRLYGAFVRELEDAAETQIDYQECGGLDLAYSDTEWSNLQERGQRQAEASLHYRAVGAEQVRTFWPRINGENLRGGLFFPGDAIVNPRELLHSLSTVCEAMGVDLRANEAVEQVHVQPSRVSITTARGTATAHAGVLAAGAWSSLVPVSGVAALPGSEPIKGHLIAYAQPAQTCGTIVRHEHYYFLQRANGMLLAGASVEHAGFDRTVNNERVHELTEKAGQIFPHLQETTPVDAWTGLRPGSSRMCMERWDDTPLYLAYGHFRNGILLAPLTAGRMCDLMIASL